MEAAIKLGRQYYVELGQPQRVNFIAREDSYHGSTLGALSMSGHKLRREKFLPMLSNNIYRVSSCYAYRQRIDHESDAEFVAKEAKELENYSSDSAQKPLLGSSASLLWGPPWDVSHMSTAT
jgi:adenosylmethionine-8-amino-7-oxononanoate aminotransferase